MPDVSIIVPIYNVERYLPRCIDSILSQSFVDFELILVDDGSPDRCGIICDEYAVKDDRIRVIHQENAKLSAARNAGLDVAQGEWIAFVDADDWVHKDYLKTLLAGALEDTDIVICGFLKILNDMVKDSDLTGVEFRDVSAEEVYKDYHVRTHAWGRLIRKSVVGELRYIPGIEPVEDICFNELLYRSNMKFRMTDAKLYYYYLRPGSASNSPMGRGILDAIPVLLGYLKKLDGTERRERIINRCYKCVLSARYSEMFSIDYRVTKKKCKELLNRLEIYSPELKAGDRLVMWGFAKFPPIYRAWRIMSDPSLLKYERKCKRSRNEHKKYKRNKRINS